jgi:aspartate kinase
VLHPLAISPRSGRSTWTCAPKTLTHFVAASTLPYLLQVLHPLAMQPAIRSQHMDVRVKNSYNRTAEGTRISKDRDMSCSLVTSIVLKNSVTLVDIVSSRMLGQYGEWGGFEAQRVLLV